MGIKEETNSVKASKGKKGSLKFRILLLVNLLGIAVAVAAVLSGIIVFQHETAEIYTNKGYEIAAVMQKIYGDRLSGYAAVLNRKIAGENVDKEIEEIVSSERYKKIREVQEDIRSRMNVNDIYVVVLDLDMVRRVNGDVATGSPNKPFYYISDCYYNHDEEYRFGDQSNLAKDYIDTDCWIWETGQITEEHFIINGPYGYNTSALLPVTDDSGKTIAIIGVEVPMSTLKEDITNYIVRVSISALLVLIFLMVVISLMLAKTVIRPIKTVSEEVGRFVKDKAEVSKILPTINTRDEIQTLSEDICQMETDVKDYIENIKNITAEKERIGAELSVATNIQASMLPSLFPPFPDRKEIDIYATMDPAKEVGGDFYDFFLVDDSHLAVVVADVSGKGVPAALFMVIGKTLIKDHTGPDTDLGQVFSEVNNLLCESNSEELFITAYEAVIDLRNGEVVYVNAGHEHPFLMTTGEDGQKEYTEMNPKAGVVLAGFEGVKYKGGTFTMKPGDRFVQYTDGVTEATNSSNELYGMERLTQFLNSHTDLGPEKLLPALKEDIDGFVKEAPQFDDITMLCFELKQYQEQ